MERIFEFATHHPFLVGSLIILIVLLVITESRKGGIYITSQQLTNIINKNDGVVLDVRERKEYNNGHITNSLNIPFNQFTQRASELKEYLSKKIIIIDSQGQHASTIAKQLKKNGINNVMRLRGGITAWTHDGMPLIK